MTGPANPVRGEASLRVGETDILLRPTFAALVAAEPFVTVTVVPVTVADDGATERTPRPNAATATSAMRLNVVFVDICFLSIVELRTIRSSAWN